MKRILFFIMCVSVIGLINAKAFVPKITEQEYAIEPKEHETCYQYAQRKVKAMIDKYSGRRIVGSIWLSEYWAHHYYGAIHYRNYFFKPASPSCLRGRSRHGYC